MSFTMTHLYIADNIARRSLLDIDNLPQFYLESIAPDAVHYRPDYVSDHKKASHLCPGSERWGMVTDNETWIANALRFAKAHAKDEDKSFALGCCAHILTDIYNNIAVWTPFRKKYPATPGSEYDGRYHAESAAVDTALALTMDARERIRENLRSASGVHLGSILSADEINRQKADTLDHWYDRAYPQNLSENTIVTLEGALEFIGAATDFVLRRLQRNQSAPLRPERQNSE